MPVPPVALALGLSFFFGLAYEDFYFRSDVLAAIVGAGAAVLIATASHLRGYPHRKERLLAIEPIIVFPFDVSVIEQGLLLSASLRRGRGGRIDNEPVRQ